RASAAPSVAGSRPPAGCRGAIALQRRRSAPHRGTGGRGGVLGVGGTSGQADSGVMWNSGYANPTAGRGGLHVAAPAAATVAARVDGTIARVAQVGRPAAMRD